MLCLRHTPKNETPGQQRLGTCDLIWRPMKSHLFFFGVQLEALGKRAGLRLHVLLLHLTQALGIGDVFILGAFKQTEGSKETTNSLYRVYFCLNSRSERKVKKINLLCVWHKIKCQQMLTVLTSLLSLCPIPPLFWHEEAHRDHTTWTLCWKWHSENLKLDMPSHSNNLYSTEGQF